LEAAGTFPGSRLMTSLHHPPFGRWSLAMLAAALLFPFLAAALDQTFYISFATRLLIYGLFATSLNLIMGFGGIESLGHAAFFGVGAYTVGILMVNGVDAAWIAWPAAMLAAATTASIIGAISLRTGGVYFIMITLAFAQMIYYVAVSIPSLGGEDGLSLFTRSTFPFDIDLSDDTTFYYVSLVLVVSIVVVMQRLINSRFGYAIQAIRENETRMEAIGIPVYRYKLACFVLGGTLAGLAGSLIANQNGRISPSLMYWTQSGSVMIMVIVGGAGYLYGGVLGAFAMLILEEVLSSYTIHWQLPMGLILLVIVLFIRGGIAGALQRHA
jgi:branched-chain amino acid transport system permease protein